MKIAHVGTFDVRNVGDLLFVDIFERQIKKRLPNAEITLFSPTGTMLPNTTKTIYPIKDLEKLQETASFDGIVVGGGDLVHLLELNILLNENDAVPTKYNAAETWITPSFVAWKYQIPLVWNALGVPAAFLESQSELLKAVALCVDYISVRDLPSRQVLQDAGIETSRIHVTPDSILSISELFSDEETDALFMRSGLQKKKYIVFQCNVTFSDAELLDYGEKLKQLHEETGLDIVLQDIGTGLEDRSALHKLDQLFPDTFILAENRFDQFQVISVLKNAKLYAGSSMHGFIISQSCGTPSLMIDKNGLTKIKGVAKMVNQEKCVVDNPDTFHDLARSLLEEDAHVSQEALSKISVHFDAITEVFQGKKVRSDRSAFAWDITNALVSLCRTEAREKDLSDELRQQRDSYRKELEGVYSSRSWKLTEPLRILNKPRVLRNNEE